MIYSRLEGGLGNQLFQYAAGRAYSLASGRPLVLDSSQLNIRVPGTTPRKLELQSLVRELEVVDVSPVSFPRLSKRLPRIASLLGPHLIVSEAFTPPERFLHRQSRSAYLIGYWQNAKYFERYRATIVDDISPTQPLRPEIARVGESIGNTNSVSVHIRRGDYISNANAAAFHGVLPMSYYVSALDYLRDRVKNATFFIFSDDIEWCCKHVSSLGADIRIVETSENRSGWEDIHLMRLAKHHIIANSSFSWWGAWLSHPSGSCTDGVVVAPAQWFARGPLLRPGDRTPLDWVLL